MIQIYRIPVPAQRLLAMPEKERVLMLLLGYTSNQLSIIQKLLVFSTNRTPEIEIEQQATGVQTHILLRLTVGALNEAWELVRTRFISTKLAPEYIHRLDSGGLAAFDALKQQFGKSSLLNAVRKNYAFHYPQSDDVAKAFAAICSDKELIGVMNFYLSIHGFNALFYVSDLVFVQGIADIAKETDLAEAQRKLMDEVSSASINLINISRSFTAAAWLQYVGTELLADQVVEITDAPHVDDVWIPFFVEIDERVT